MRDYEWNVKCQYDILLFDLMRQSIYGKKRTTCIYVVMHDDVCMYVGQTRCGIRKRMFQHVADHSLLGNFLLFYDGRYEDLRCYLVLIRGNINNAEKAYIHHFKPALNETMYVCYKDKYEQDKYSIPPIDRSKTVIMPGSAEEWERKYNPITGMKINKCLRADFENMLTLGSEYIDPLSSEYIDRLYNKAYRDPSNPAYKQ